MEHKNFKFNVRVPWPSFRLCRSNLRRLLPTPSNVIFTLAMIALLVAAQTAGALPLARTQPAPAAASTGTIAYQGRLADAAGAPLTGTYNMIFRLYDAATGGTPLWSEPWTGSNGVKVSDGLFNVMLGSLAQLPISQFTNSQSLFLGITVGTDDEMAPRVQLGSVPFAVQALMVPDGSVTTGKIADGAVTQAKLADQVLGQFGGRPNSYPYVLHLRHFALNMGNFCYGYVPGDPARPDCASTQLNNFTSGLKLYAPSGNGYAGAANNLPALQVDFGAQTTTSSPRWGYAYSFFLNNAGAARTVQLPVSSCNDIAIYVSSGTVASDQLGDAISLQYHRFPGNSGNDLLGCPCDGNLNPTMQIPSGAFRLTLLTRGAACTSYGTIGGATTNWIRDASLAIDWPGLRTYLGEQ
jgi:hypothetical protein